MTANTKLIQVIADALIGEYEEEATEWLEDGGRANIERIVAEWRAAIEQGRWVERLEDVLVLRALRHEGHWVTVLGGPDTEALRHDLPLLRLAPPTAPATNPARPSPRPTSPQHPTSEIVST